MGIFRLTANYGNRGVDLRAPWIFIYGNVDSGTENNPITLGHLQY